MEHLNTLENEASYNRMETLKFARQASDIELIVKECYRQACWDDCRS